MTNNDMKSFTNMVKLPPEQLKWKTEAYQLRTPLGVSEFEADVLDWDGELTLRPGEHERLVVLQASKYLKKVICGELELEVSSLRHLLLVNGLKQADIAKAAAIGPSTLSNFFAGERISAQTVRQITVLLQLELEQSGFIKNLIKMTSSESVDALLQKWDGTERRRA